MYGERVFNNISAGQENHQQVQQTAQPVNLPHGGRTLRDIGEKFAANQVTDTGSMTVPIATSPGCSGFGSQLSLSYDSGSGKGPFGFGWPLSLPQIIRKTNKGLPLYQDVEDSDVLLLSDSEDLVPVFKKGPNGEWELDTDGHHIVVFDYGGGYHNEDTNQLPPDQHNYGYT